MFDLTGKKALVTGATGGIGGEIARALHAQGASVVLSGTRQEALDQLRDELGDRVGQHLPGIDENLLDELTEALLRDREQLVAQLVDVLAIWIEELVLQIVDECLWIARRQRLHDLIENAPQTPAHVSRQRAEDLAADAQRFGEEPAQLGAGRYADRAERVPGTGKM